MKPTGPIPPEWLEPEALDAAESWAAAGTPLFVYDSRIVAARVARLRAALPSQVAVHYAVKANPFPPLLAAIAPLVDGLDIASTGEMAKALAVKPATAISFAGPGKRDAELAAAITAGVTLNLESIGEAERALTIAARLGRAPRLAVRVNPDFALRGAGMKMGGLASPFGVDAAEVPALVRRLLAAGVDWRGFHIFIGSQNLDAAALIGAQAATVTLVARLADAIGATPPLVNLGGGFGIPYFHGDLPLDVESVGAALAIAITRLDSAWAIELGRWLVGEAGLYLARVIDRKYSRGETFLVLDGGLHHQLAASGHFGTVVRRNYPLGVVGRLHDPVEEQVSIVGPLCTPLDRLGDQVGLPRTEVGDLIGVFLAGAYGFTASPQAFLGHPPAREIVLPTAEPAQGFRSGL